jgi:hypothetical protein
MKGLIGPDLRRDDCWSGSSHDDWRKTFLMEFLRWNFCRKTRHIPGRSREVLKLKPPFSAARPR